MKIIENTPDYTVIEREFSGIRQEFRVWKESKKVEVRFTDEFARAHGYEGLTDMVIRTGMTEWLADNGGVAGVAERRFCASTPGERKLKKKV